MTDFSILSCSLHFDKGWNRICIYSRFCEAEIKLRLKSEPKIRTIAAELSKSHCHLGSDSLTFCENIV